MKRDNTTKRRKVALRLALLRELQARGVAPADVVVVETHGGWGTLGRHCYADVERGVVFEKDALRAARLAALRPTWAVYEGDCEAALAAGVGAHVEATLLDVDPYSDPWPALRAFFESERPRAPVLAVAVNDGLRQKLRLNAGWHVKSLAMATHRYGNSALYANYLEICKDLLSEAAAASGGAYRLERWRAYYCGHADEMTHYGAIFVSRRRARRPAKDRTATA